MKSHLLATTVAAVAATLLFGGCGAGSPAGDGDDRSPSTVSDSDPTTSDSGPRGELVVTVVDTQGNPVRAAQVLPGSLDEDGHAFGQIGRATGVDGKFTMTIPPGNYRLNVQCGTDVKGEPQDVEVEADETYELEFVIDVDLPEGGTCTG